MGDFFGGLLGGLGSIFGGLMNTSSAQAINAANLQQSMFMANNAVAMRVADAKRSGINPLAALGVSTPGFAAQTPTDPGQGLMQAGGKMMGLAMDFDHQEKMKAIDREKGRADIELAHRQGQRLDMATQLDYLQGAKLEQAIQYLRDHPEVMPEGVQFSPLHQGSEGLRSFWERIFANPRLIPGGGSYNTP